MGAGAELGEMVAKVVGMLSAAGMVGMIVGGVEVEGEVEGEKFRLHFHLKTRSLRSI